MKNLGANLAKQLIRQSGLLMSLSFKVRGFRVLESLAEMDQFFEDCLAGSSEVTWDALTKMSKAYLKLPSQFNFNMNPFSPEYDKLQDELYSFIANRKYSVDNEATEFDYASGKNNFFPYNTGSGSFVGGQLESHGFVIKNIMLPKGAKIVEFGAGWGNLTIHLALMGYQMTAVEVNEPSIALMAHRAGIHERTIEFAKQDMVTFAEETKHQYDAGLFLASFHHAHNHRKIIENFNRFIKPGGLVYFADEPIVPASNPTLPYPWGLRLDAATLYYVRKHGWLELGFASPYFRTLLKNYCWHYRTIPAESVGKVDMQVLSRK